MNLNEIQVLVIEDEKPAARSLIRKLELMGFSHIDMVHSVHQGKIWFANHSEPDLIFMDIQLSDGLSFEILENHPVDSKIIFTTAYNEYALKAFKLNSIDYLLKPIVEQELAFAVDKFLKNQNTADKNMLHDLKQLLVKDQFKTRFNVKIGQQIRLVPVEDIECIYAENKGTYLFTKEGDNFLLDQPLDRVEEVLDPKLFFRINRGQIIHIHAIKNIAVHSNSRLKIYFHKFQTDDGIVSRERVNDFKSWID